MQKIEHFNGRTMLFVFDLEFIGDVRNLQTCLIWEIAVFCVATNKWFIKVVDPDPTMLVFPPPPIPEIPLLERSFLQTQKAVLWDVALQELKEWVDLQMTMGYIPVFISHNTFRADKPILELECKRYNMRMPLHWFFFDSLHFSRAVIRNSTGNYSLSGLHEQLFNRKIENVHRAKSDVVACIHIMNELTKNVWNLTGPIYPAYSTSLRSIRWVGRKAEDVFYNENVRSVEGLFTRLQQNIITDYLTLCLNENTSITKTLNLILQNKLPPDNITSIINVVIALRKTTPFSYTFMLSPLD